MFATNFAFTAQCNVNVWCCKSINIFGQVFRFLPLQMYKDNLKIPVVFKTLY